MQISYKCALILKKAINRIILTHQTKLKIHLINLKISIDKI